MARNTRGRRLAPQAQREERRRQVSERMLRGLSEREIAVELGVSKSTVSNDVQAVRAEWKEARLDDWDALVDEERQLLNALIGTYLPTARSGDLDAAEFVRRTAESRRKLLGLNAPELRELRGNVEIDLRAALLTSADWREFRWMLLDALKPHPAAEADVRQVFAALCGGETDEQPASG